MSYGPKPKPLKERLLSGIEIDPETGCWLWQRNKTPGGYGVMRLPGTRKKEGVHRIAFKLFVKPIQDGLYILHHCDIRHCCNPEHLYEGTAKDNIQDAIKRGKWDRSKWIPETCKHGHNDWYVYPHRRSCRTCALRKKVT